MAPRFSIFVFSLLFIGVFVQAHEQKFEKSEKPEIYEKSEKSEKSEKYEKSEKPEKYEKSEKPEKSEKYEKSEKPEKSEKYEKSKNSEKSKKSEKSEKSVTFSYEGSHGPKKWGSLSPNYVACSKGKLQSPVDIVKDETKSSKKLKTIDRNYSAANATLINNGFNIGVHFGKSSGGVAKIDGKNYKLKQMDWHCPSEHTINGEQYAAELHLHHQADDGSLAVIATLLKHGDPNPLLKKIEDKLEELAKEKCGSDEEAHIAVGVLDPKDMMKKIPKYYRYIGSLTTPPCTEKVVWSILGKVRTISKEQVEALKKPLDSNYKNNARPPQPLHGRKIELYDETGHD